MKNTNSKHVLFLGAGASHDAGYPLTNEVFDILEKNYKQSSINDYAERWNKFSTAISDISDDVQIVVDSKNAELILTLPDLLITAENEYKNNQINEADRVLSEGGQYKFKFKKKRKIILQAEEIKDAFTTLLNDYFLMKHCEDATRTLSPYLSNMLKATDCIITTNWDTLSERILLQMGKWFPSDGYGFNVTLREDFDVKKGERKDFPPSSVPVLKLHGSIGWYKSGNNQYLRKNSYLQYLIPNISDINAPRYGDEGNAVMIYPSYLKQLNDSWILSVWNRARKFLEDAEEITIVGYSLPKADVAIRTLLLPLRANNAKVKIISMADEKSDERKRWLEYFQGVEKEPQFIVKRAEEHFC